MIKSFRRNKVKNTATSKSTTASRAPRAKKSTPTAVNTSKAITAELRNAMTAEAAYYISEKCGFNPALTDQCWLEAEKQIDAKILEF